MRSNWDRWFNEACDHLDCRHGRLREAGAERFERDAWLAWSAGRDAVEFAEEYLRDRQPEAR